jgi:hypothetical protein
MTHKAPMLHSITQWDFLLLSGALQGHGLLIYTGALQPHRRPLSTRRRDGLSRSRDRGRGSRMLASPCAQWDPSRMLRGDEGSGLPQRFNGQRPFGRLGPCGACWAVISTSVPWASLGEADDGWMPPIGGETLDPRKSLVLNAAPCRAVGRDSIDDGLTPILP